MVFLRAIQARRTGGNPFRQAITSNKENSEMSFETLAPENREQTKGLLRNLLANTDMVESVEGLLVGALRQFEVSEAPMQIVGTLVQALVLNFDDEIERDLVQLIRVFHEDA